MKIKLKEKYTRNSRQTRHLSVAHERLQYKI